VLCAARPPSPWLSPLSSEVLEMRVKSSPCANLSREPRNVQLRSSKAFCAGWRCGEEENEEKCLALNMMSCEIYFGQARAFLA
jgi:hypothetical protein